VACNGSEPGFIPEWITEKKREKRISTNKPGTRRLGEQGKEKSHLQALYKPQAW
jgi:hypothetical protein